MAGLMPVRLRRVATTSLRLLICLALALTIAPFQPSPARAGYDDCAALGTAISPAAVKAGYSFIKNHNSCIPYFEDPTFQAIAASVATAQETGAVSPAACATLLDQTSNDAAQEIISIAGAATAHKYISCACQVVNSELGEYAITVVKKIAACGATFNPLEPLGDGLKQAEKGIDGLGGLLGIGGSEQDPRAGVGNGGAPTTYCVYGAVGEWHPAQGCGCPGSTKIEWGTGPNEGLVRCVGDCPPGQISKGGACEPCPSGGGGSQGPNGGSSWKWVPNETQTACVKESSGYSCGDGKKASGGTCVWACPQGEVWDKATKTCSSCPQGQVPAYVSGAGSMGTCKPCGPNQQVIGYQCQACPSGSALNEAGVCQSVFPPQACEGRTINDPDNPYSCIPCPEGKSPAKDHKSCIARPRITITPTPMLPLPAPGGTTRPKAPPIRPRGG